MILVGALLGLGACDDVESEPDAGPGLIGLDRCELWQDYDLVCRGAPCDRGLMRVCGVDKVCQQWPDCETGECFQCRSLFWCECQ